MRYCSLSRIMLVLAIFLVSVPIISHAAPHGATCHDSENCESSINQYQESSNAIEEILFDTIFNSTDNSRIVKRTFREQPGTHKICTLVAYNVTCDEDSDISPQCNESDPQCILGLYNILWTEFDSSDTAGTLLLYLASNGFSVLGFEWAGACDLLQDDSNAANLSLVLPSSLCNGNQSDIDLKEEIMLSLIYITTLMPNYAIVSSAPSLKYEDVITGYAIEYVGYNDLIGDLYTAVFPLVICYVSILITLGFSHSLYVSIHDTIQIDKKPPKLYYHFWSAVCLSFGWLLYQLTNYYSNYNISNYTLLSYVSVCSLMNGIVCIAMASSTKEESALLFPAPLTLVCCNDKARKVYSWLMTVFGYFVTLALVTYIIFAIPSIVFVYYLYPTRTAVRLPFIVGAIFDTIILMSLVLYEIEKFLYALLDVCCSCCHGDNDHDTYSETEMEPINHHQHKNYSGTQIHRRPRESDQNMKQQVERKHDKEYMQIIWEDSMTVRRSCRMFYFWNVYVLQPIASLTVLIIYLYSAYLLAKFVFKQTKKVDGIDALLTLVPTFLSFGVTWIGRSYIFDVKKAEQNNGDTQTSNEGVTERERPRQDTQAASEREDQHTVETRQLQVQEEIREPVPPEMEISVTIEDEDSENQGGTLRVEKEQRVIDYAKEEGIPLLQ